jgi:hypothetical protein
LRPSRDRANKHFPSSKFQFRKTETYERDRGLLSQKLHSWEGWGSKKLVDILLALPLVAGS